MKQLISNVEISISEPTKASPVVNPLQSKSAYHCPIFIVESIKPAPVGVPILIFNSSLKPPINTSGSIFAVVSPSSSAPEQPSNTLKSPVPSPKPSNTCRLNGPALGSAIDKLNVSVTGLKFVPNPGP